MFTKTLLPDTLRAVQLVSDITEVKFAYLAGGTAKWTVWGKIGQTKFSLFYYKYPLLEKTLLFEGLQLASLVDIAAMKIHAIVGRGTRRDFVDVYFLSKKYTLEEMLGFYQKKYAISEDHLYSTLRALDYFEDAEQEKQMPQMLVQVNWEEIKEYFKKETRKLTEKKLQKIPLLHLCKIS